MRAAILAVGESLPRYCFSQEKYDLVIGVNRAVKEFTVDYWSAHDALTFGLVAPIGHPIIVTDQPQRDRMLVRFPEARLYDFLDKGKFHDAIPVPLWWEFSVTSALATAKHLGAKEIVTFGCDGSWAVALDLTHDWDGYSDSEQIRNEARWTKEQPLWKRCVDALRNEGITVEPG